MATRMSIVEGEAILLTPPSDPDTSFVGMLSAATKVRDRHAPHGQLLGPFSPLTSQTQTSHTSATASAELAALSMALLAQGLTPPAPVAARAGGADAQPFDAFANHAIRMPSFGAAAPQPGVAVNGIHTADLLALQLQHLKRVSQEQGQQLAALQQSSRLALRRRSYSDSALPAIPAGAAAQNGTMSGSFEEADVQTNASGRVGDASLVALHAQMANMSGARLDSIRRRQLTLRRGKPASFEEEIDELREKLEVDALSQQLKQQAALACFESAVNASKGPSDGGVDALRTFQQQLSQAHAGQNPSTAEQLLAFRNAFAYPSAHSQTSPGAPVGSDGQGSTDERSECDSEGGVSGEGDEESCAVAREYDDAMSMDRTDDTTSTGGRKRPPRQTHEERRDRHMASEKVRRRNMQTAMSDLQDAIPNYHNRKASKLDVVVKAVEYVHALQALVARLKIENMELKRAVLVRDGVYTPTDAALLDEKADDASKGPSARDIVAARIAGKLVNRSEQA